MFKRQKSKILVFLLMLGILYGCKRQILDPLNSQKNLPQKAQFDKVKGFYENGRYKNQPKRTSSNGNERMTAQDSARFKDFEPEWDKTEVELLPNNEKMLIVPVVRFLNVDYNQSLGFIRRLCIRVDANDDFLEANIVELVGNLTFVKANYNSIFKNYKNANIIGFTGVISIYELDYTVIIRKAYSLSNFTKNVVTEDVHVDNFSTDLVSVTPCVLIIYGYPDANGNGGATVIIDFCDGTTTVAGGSSGGGGSGTGTGTTGNTGSSGVYIPYIEPIIPRPPKRYELPPVVAVPTTTEPTPPRDPGISWAYTLYGDTEATPEETALLKSLDSLSNGLGAVDRKDEMSPENRLLLATTLRELRNSSPAYEKMYQDLRVAAVPNPNDPNDHRASVFKILPTTERGRGRFVYQAGVGTVKIKQAELRNQTVVAEELLHAYQYLVAYKIALLNPNFVDNDIDFEFEVKLIMHAIRARTAPRPGVEPPKAGSFYQNVNGVNSAESDELVQSIEVWFRNMGTVPATFSWMQMAGYVGCMVQFQTVQQNNYMFPASPSFMAPQALPMLFR